MIGTELICIGSMSSLTPSALMIHEIDPTVKIWPGYGRDEERAKHTILFDMETSCSPLPGAPTIDIGFVCTFSDKLKTALHNGCKALGD